MGSRASRTLVATAPDGTEVTQETSGSYDTAGLLQAADGHWLIAARGWSRNSVYNRAHARYNRGDYQAIHVSDLTEQTAPVVRAYFGTHAVAVDQVYGPGTHQGLTEAQLREVLRIAGANMEHADGVALVARNHPGEEGHAGIRTGSGSMASISYADGKFSLAMPGGWHRFRSMAGRQALRHLARHGWTTVAFAHAGRVADFQVSELLESMKGR